MADPEDANGSFHSSTLPRNARRCRIPRLNRSNSVKLKNERLECLKAETRPKSLTMSNGRDYNWQLDSRYTDLGSMNSMPYSVDDDMSVKSFGSCVSYNSCASHSQATESVSRPISRTHYGKKYALHCEHRHLTPEEYLTPTQRKDKEIRQLKMTLRKQNKSFEEKVMENEKLKDELRRVTDVLSCIKIGNNAMNSSQESDNLDSMDIKHSSVISFGSSESVRSDIQTAAATNDDSGVSNVMSMSLSTRNSSEISDLDNNRVATADKAVNTGLVLSDFPLDGKTDASHRSSIASSDCSVVERGQSSCLQQGDRISELTAAIFSQEFDKFTGTYKQELEELKSQHKEHYQDLKARFSESVDHLLLKLTEANTRYLELRPLFERAQDKIQNIESQLTEVQKDIESQEDYHNQMYIKMYRKGQEAARLEQADEALDFTQQLPKRVSVPELLKQLRQLEAELDETKTLYREAARGMGDRQAEYTLRFLKDAVFYFLTKKDKDHLKAIQSILGFTEAERLAVSKAMKHRRLFCSPFKFKKRQVETSIACERFYPKK